MRKSIYPAGRIIFFLGCLGILSSLGILTGCAGSSPASQAPAPIISLTVQGPTTLQTGQTATYTATVNGTSNTLVQWGSSNGAITQGGIFTAPSQVGTTFITAISQADSSKSSSIVVQVTQANRPPEAPVINGPATVTAGVAAQFTLQSTDPDGDIITFSSTSPGASVQGSNLTLIAPVSYSGSTLTLLVIANDSKGLSSAAGMKTVQVQSAVAVPSFSGTGSMGMPRTEHTATLLPNGKVLIAGGIVTSGGPASVELYDPATRLFTITGGLGTARYMHTATLLPNGKVLIVGGYNARVLTSAELYDPATGNFTSTGHLILARWGHTATLLPNGHVLIAGGVDNNSAGDQASAELYDPATGSFTFTTGNLNTTRSFHTATLLLNGKVLIAGSDGHSREPASAELYDPATASFTSTGHLIIARAGHTATLLPNGHVLIAGGGGDLPVELYDPATGSFTYTGTTITARSYHFTAALLPNGKVLIAGGINGSGYLASAELYDPITGNFSATGNLITARAGHTGTLLPNGKVLIAGGETTGFNPDVFLASAELYQ